VNDFASPIELGGRAVQDSRTNEGCLVFAFRNRHQQSVADVAARVCEEHVLAEALVRLSQFAVERGK